MTLLLTSLLLALTPHSSSAHSHSASDDIETIVAAPGRTINGIPYSTRVHWMRRANQALSDLGSRCPFAAFGTVIVNHTAGGLGELVCIGANENRKSGNPAMHGEIAAITNCTKILTDPKGPYQLTPSQALAAFADLSLYTNAESCPMCAAAIRWAGFREYIYGTSINTLIEQGWGQIRVSSQTIFEQAYDLPTQSRLIANVLTNETDPYFAWQFNPKYACPVGCQRPVPGQSCTKV